MTPLRHMTTSGRTNRPDGRNDEDGHTARRGGGPRGRRRRSRPWRTRAQHLGLPDDEDRAGRGSPDRGRGPRPPEGTDPRGEGREAPHAGRGRGRGPGQAQRTLRPRAPPPAARRAARPAQPRWSNSATASSSTASASSTRPARTWPERRASRSPPSSASRACPPRTPSRVLIQAVKEEAEHDAVKIARAIERAAREEAQDGPATSS